MSIQNRSVLRFKNYIVKEIQYKINNKFNDENEKVALDFSFDHGVEYFDEQKCMEVELTVYIFTNAQKNNYPFEMKVSLTGFFEVEARDFDIRMFESNALAIMFPYLRALVSTYTANANLAPVILPAMNINAYLRNKYKNIQ